MCCRLLGIKAPPQLVKPKGEWCGHCHVGKGCMIYEARPKPCRDFECMWLQSQIRGPQEAWPEHLRPDKSKMVLSVSLNDDKIVVAHMDPKSPVDWRKGGMTRIFGAIIQSGMRVLLGDGKGRHWLIEEQGLSGVIGSREVVMSEEDENGVQWFRGYKHPRKTDR